MKQELLVIKTKAFPVASQTFIVSNAIEALRQGFDVRILCNHKRPFTYSSQTNLLNKYKLDSKVEAFKLPKNVFKRFSFATFCFLHPSIAFYFLKYSYQFKSFELNILFKLFYYKPYRRAKVFHIHFADSADIVPKLKMLKFIKSKIVVTFHGYDASYMHRIHLNTLRECYKELFEVANKVTANTKYLEKKILELGCPKDKLEIVPTGINLDFFKPSIYPKKVNKINEICLISVGRLIPLKGFEYGIRTLKTLLDYGYNVNYNIVGEGVLYHELKGLIDEFKLNQNINMLGELSQEEVKDLLDKSHIFLMTSISDKGKEEAQGVVSYEAQAMGLPVVGFESGGVPFTVSDKTGILVPERDSKALADAIIKLVNNENLYESMSLASRNWVISYFNISNTVMSYYKDIF
jgi:colanic acid/amylovoran biosynthesis glycosyltransferase